MNLSSSKVERSQKLNYGEFRIAYLSLSRTVVVGDAMYFGKVLMAFVRK